MSKYDVTIWSDYVRGLVDPPARAELSAHLALPGSASARRTVAAFEGLLAFAARDAAAEPPASALRGAKALGALLRPQESRQDRGWLRRLSSLLVFDSAAAPLLQGVRDMAPADRQLIYRHDDYFVDLRLEPEPGGDWTVVGQLLAEKDGDGQGVAALPGVAILAASGGRFVGRARTGELGEFQAQGLPGDGLHLLFLVDDEICLEVPVGQALRSDY